MLPPPSPGGVRHVPAAFNAGSAASRTDASAVLKEAATVYKVDVEAIAAKVKIEFAAMARAKKEAEAVPKKKAVA